MQWPTCDVSNCGADWKKYQVIYNQLGVTGTVQVHQTCSHFKNMAVSFFGYVISISLVPRLPPVRCMGELGTGLHLGMRVPEQGQCKMAVCK